MSSLPSLVAKIQKLPCYPAYIRSYLSSSPINFSLSPLSPHLVTCVLVNIYNCPTGSSAWDCPNPHALWPNWSFQSKSITSSHKWFNGFPSPWRNKGPHSCRMNTPLTPSPAFIHSLIHSSPHSDELSHCIWDIACSPGTTSPPGTEAYVRNTQESSCPWQLYSLMKGPDLQGHSGW